MSAPALLRYAPWQMRDYAIAKGVPTFLVSVLTGYLNFAPVMANGEVPTGAPTTNAAGALASTLVAVVLVGALFATNGLVSDDRRLGYFRFLFAKPVIAWRFYAQKFAVHLVGFLLVMLALLGVHAIAVAPLLPVALLPAAAVLFVSVGGIGFLASALWRFDWAALATFLVAASLVWDRWGNAIGWRGMVPLIFPPMPRFGDVAAAAATGAAPDAASLVWVAGYGMVCFLLGVWVLRRRDLA